eukprot:1054995-Amphidinium_carterae.1
MSSAEKASTAGRCARDGAGAGKSVEHKLMVTPLCWRGLDQGLEAECNIFCLDGSLRYTPRSGAGCVEELLKAAI